MGTLYAGILSEKISSIVKKTTVPDEDTTVEGDRVIWDLTAPGAARTITLKNYDMHRHAQYLGHGGERQPHIVIRCKQNCGVNNITIVDEALNTLATLAADYSGEARFVVFRLTSAKAWELI